jgi:hypothetical protein
MAWHEAYAMYISPCGTTIRQLCSKQRRQGINSVPSQELDTLVHKLL